MIGTSQEQKDIFTKLAIVARGDLDLVQEAIRQNTPTPVQRAALDKVVRYILDHRDKEAARAR